MNSLRLPAKIESLEPFRAFVAREFVTAGMHGDHLNRVELVLEEMLTNLVFHAYKKEPGDAVVECFAEGDRFCIRFLDDGPAFNPLTRPPPDTTQPLEDRQVGGLGIHLVKNMADGLDYRRENEKNVLTVCFRKSL